ncbi:MAG: hypothetical protein H0T89_33245 [Deltaproteobacteria bacterium]|nr:hypothetical protein [Deltaproteobacteria bacterium]MDQ3300971.1 hypothetical protein [Myxococcota bacterium]
MIRGIAFLLLIGGAGALLWIFVIRDDGPSGPATVEYVAVAARTTRASAGGISLTVDVELEAKSALPPGAPHVIVHARCEDATDDALGSFQLLANAQPGDRKVDSIELFSVRPFAQEPTTCELTLTMSEGATAPQRYCFQLGQTTAGPC